MHSVYRKGLFHDTYKIMFLVDNSNDVVIDGYENMLRYVAYHPREIQFELHKKKVTTEEILFSKQL